MPKPRYAQVSLEATPYYHCISRCVRGAFLCGTDNQTGNTYEHRKQLIENKIQELSSIFAIDVCAYAVMSNHYHLVLHINRLQAERYTLAEVIEQWHLLFNGTLYSQRYAKGKNLLKCELAVLKKQVNTWRKQLMDISWFMRVLNEDVARTANKEDQCTGRFWEGRFKSQALLDEAALATCMAYVDLNPIRARLADNPEASQHTSIKQRIESLQLNHTQQTQPPHTLYPFTGNPRKNSPEGLPFKLTDYIELVKQTGQIMREDKRGYITKNIPTLLHQLNIEPKHWQYLTMNFESKLKGLVGSVHKIKQACKTLGYQRDYCSSWCENYFP